MPLKRSECSFDDYQQAFERALRGVKDLSTANERIQKLFPGCSSTVQETGENSFGINFCRFPDSPRRENHTIFVNTDTT